MADNDNFEWTNAFTGAVITGDATVQQPPSRADAVVDSRGCAGRPIVAHVARSTASWRRQHYQREPIGDAMVVGATCAYRGHAGTEFWRTRGCT